MNPTVVTFLCVDTDTSAASSAYPNIGKTVSPRERRTLYWKNVVVSLATARRCLPGARLCVATNDLRDLKFDASTLNDLLKRLGVDRIALPFVHFLPLPGVSKTFRNVFYRFDVIRYLATHADLGESIILTDSDCVWTRALPALDTRVPQTGLWLSSPYGVRDPQLKHPHRLSRAELGDFYRQLNPDYPEPHPTCYGGEFIGGRHAAWDQLSASLQAVWTRIAVDRAAGALHLPNGWGLFDNDELILNFVYNSRQLGVTLADGFMRRIITLEGVSNVKPADVDLPLWHLPSEKRRGFVLLFDRVLDLNSDFWKSPIEEFHRVLGNYLGVPARRFDLPYTPPQQMERHARIGARWLRRTGAPVLDRIFWARTR